MRKLILASLCFLSFQLYSQIVTIDPPFFDQTSDITVTYDVTQGNAGLVGVFPVYMHAGLITEGNDGWQHVIGDWGTDDPLVKMTYVGNNRHQISYNIEEFHGIEGQSVVVEQLAFVFRNVNGSKEGKTANLGDIFVDVPGLGEFSGFFQSPDPNELIIEELGNTLNIRAVFSQVSELKLYDNDNIISEQEGTVLEYEYQINDTDAHTIRFEASNGEEVLRDSFDFITRGETIIIDPPEGTEPGVNRIGEGHVRLCLYAPGQEFVVVGGSFSDFGVRGAKFMKNSVDGTKWWIDLTGLEEDVYHLYGYNINGNIIVGDPYSELIRDGWNDPYIPEETFPGLPYYPFNSGVLSMFKVNKEEYPWENNDYERPPKENLIIYELLMRDFIEAQNYQTLIDTLDYLENLGVNAIELMPNQEFEGNQSWGYNPSYHMALDKAYGTPEKFKEFVDKSHSRGIAVILDVVYNHAFGSNPYVGIYWDSNTSKPAVGNPFFNPDATHPFNVGYDMNHESSATKEYVKKIMAYWIDEYKIDGFRFDLSKGFTQTVNSSVEAWSNYDQSRVNILKDYADFCWSIDSDFYIILEHLGQNNEEKELANHGMMLWGKMTEQYAEASMGYHENNKSDFYWASHLNRGWDDPNLIAYMESHDEERLMYKTLNFGNSQGNYNTRDLVTALDRFEMAATFFIPIPGPKMLWQFGELGYDYSINRCEDGSINNNCRLSPKPVRWDYFEEKDRKDLYKIMAKLNYLKTTEPLFLTDNFELNTPNALKRIIIIGEENNAIIIGNFDLVQGSIDPQFPNTGWWYDYISGDSINVTDPNANISLAPGEFYLYLDKRVDFTNSTHELDINDFGEITLYPNPAQQFFTIDFNSEIIDNVSLELRDISGRVLHRKSNVDVYLGLNKIEVQLTQKPADGIYLVILNNGESQITKKLLIGK